MSRRMYSKSQLEGIVEDKIKGFDRATPTDIKGEGDKLYLVHDGEELTPQKRVHLKQLFGKDSLIGDGNIDLFIHFICISTGKHDATVNNQAIYITLPSSNNLTADSITDLNTLLGTGKRYIGCSGYVYDGSTVYTVTALNYSGNVATSKLDVHSSDETLGDGIPFSSYFTKDIQVEDAVITL